MNVIDIGTNSNQPNILIKDLRDIVSPLKIVDEGINKSEFWLSHILSLLNDLKNIDFLQLLKDLINMALEWLGLDWLLDLFNAIKGLMSRILSFFKRVLNLLGLGGFLSFLDFFKDNEILGMLSHILDFSGSNFGEVLVSSKNNTLDGVLNNVVNSMLGNTKAKESILTNVLAKLVSVGFRNDLTNPLGPFDTMLGNKTKFNRSKANLLVTVDLISDLDLGSIKKFTNWDKFTGRFPDLGFLKNIDLNIDEKKLKGTSFKELLTINQRLSGDLSNGYEYIDLSVDESGKLPTVYNNVTIDLSSGNVNNYSKVEFIDMTSFSLGNPLMLDLLKNNIMNGESDVNAEPQGLSLDLQVFISNSVPETKPPTFIDLMK